MSGVLAGLIGSFKAASAVASYESIATVSVGSGGAANVEFTNIPSGFTHLQIRCIAKTNRATYSNDGVFIRFNSDTAANYSTHYIFGKGDGTVTTSYVNHTYFYTVSSATGNGSNYANAFGVMVVDILDYKDANKYKTIRTINGEDTSGNLNEGVGIVSMTSGNWRSNNAITSITLDQELSTTFQQYSHFALYGIKAA